MPKTYSLYKSEEQRTTQGNNVGLQIYLQFYKCIYLSFIYVFIKNLRKLSLAQHMAKVRKVSN